jgi:hypothetical protein
LGRVDAVVGYKIISKAGEEYLIVIFAAATEIAKDGGFSYGESSWCVWSSQWYYWVSQGGRNGIGVSPSLFTQASGRDRGKK